MKRYLLAVSGGVDSVVMLDEMSRIHDRNELVVVHFDHGIQEESWHAAGFTERLAQKYGIEFIVGSGQLGDVSENTARQARWKFLRSVQKQQGGVICTAHHLDDVLETMLLNLQRGTGWRGLASLRETDTVKRPLLELTKSQIRNIALKRRLEWIEDESNRSNKYARNRLRYGLLSRASPSQKEQLQKINRQLVELRPQIEDQLRVLADQHSEVGDEGARLNRTDFAQLPKEVQTELMMFLIKSISRSHKNLTKKHLAEAVNFVLTKPTGKEMQLPSGVRIHNRNKSEALIIQT